MEHREQREPRLGNKLVKAQVGLTGFDEHGEVLMTKVHFQNVTQDDILKWLTRLVEAIPALQHTLLPTEHPIALAEVDGVEVPLNDEGEVVNFEWRILASKPDEVLFPPYDEEEIAHRLGRWRVQTRMDEHLENGRAVV
jgi:hypothetical protein